MLAESLSKNTIIMKNTSKILLILILLLTVINCTNDDDSAKNLILIRIENASDYKYENIYIHPSSSYATGQGNKNYGNLNPMTVSEYKNFDFAYPYAAVQITIENKIYTLMPIDFVGEKPLKSGQYTYKITANSSTNGYEKLHLTLIKE